MLTSDSNQEVLKKVGFWHYYQTQLDYNGQIVTIKELDILQRNVWLSNGDKLTFDQVARLHEYKEVRYS